MPPVGVENQQMHDQSFDNNKASENSLKNKRKLKEREINVE
jgi:hypothetical protein